MLSDALKQLTTMAQDAITAERSVTFPKPPGLPINQLLMIDRSGNHEIIEIPAPPRHHNLRTVAEIPAFVKYASEKLVGKPSVWIAADAVVVLIHDVPGGLINEYAKVSLDYSPQFKLLTKWELEPVSFDHPEFLRMLRRYFSASLPNFETLLKMLRKIQFNNGVQMVSTAETKRQSLGKEITASVENGDATAVLPETLDLTLSVYDDSDLKQQVVIKAMLDITPAGQFRLIPLAGSTLRAIDVSLKAICSEFFNFSDDVPVFFGTP